MAKKLYDILKEDFKDAVILAKEIEDEKIPYISTGLTSLDWALLGIGGIPTRRIISIWGDEASGKSTLANKIISSYQSKMHKDDTNYPVKVDAEEADDLPHLKNLGVDTNKLIMYPSPSIERTEFVSGEEKVKFALAAIKAQAPLVVVDSLAAIQTKAKAEGEPGESHVGRSAFLQTHLIRSANEILRPNNSTLIVINHGTTPFGQAGMFKTQQQKGAEILKFLQSTEIHLRTSTQIKIGEKKIGKDVWITIKKNKVASPFGRHQYRLMNGIGFDAFHDLLMIGLAVGVIKKEGSHIGFNGIKSAKPVGKGSKTSGQFKEFLKQIGGSEAKKLSVQIIQKCKEMN